MRRSRNCGRYHNSIFPAQTARLHPPYLSRSLSYQSPRALAHDRVDTTSTIHNRTRSSGIYSLALGNHFKTSRPERRICISSHQTYNTNNVLKASNIGSPVLTSALRVMHGTGTAPPRADTEDSSGGGFPVITNIGHPSSHSTHAHVE